MEFRFRTLFVTVAVALSGLVSCEEPDGPDEPVIDLESGVSNVVNTYETRNISHLGTTVSIKFDAAVAWTASIKTNPEKDDAGKEWATINSNTVSGEAKEGATVRIAVSQNKSSEKRRLELWITAEGFEPERVATLTQASSGSSVDAEMNRTLNTFMHDILKEDYLFVDAYNELEVDLTVPYTEFLPTHLLAMGDVNVEDGGYYKPVQNNSGERFIYSSLVELAPVTRSAQIGNLGFGPFISTALEEGSTEMGIAASFVRRGSPAEKAGMRRGDIVYAVNGNRLTTRNYQSYMHNLYQNAVGEYTLDFLRYEANDAGGYTLNSYKSQKMYAGAHIFDPILHASVLTYPEDPSIKIGYLVFETFDLNSQEFLVETIDNFVSEGITDMILDLRFNYGGAVAQSRWLSGCIAGAANWDKTFCKVVFNDGETENWTFGNGYTAETDNLGQPKDLGLTRLYVIGSYNTASAAELVINSLKGIDFPVKLIGSSTEGKNVGMNVSQTEYKGRTFQFQPVTFWVRNAKDWGDYADGFRPDEYVNNDNVSLDDDADNVFPYSFSDWGNMDFNIALQWAYCDITGKARWDDWTKEQNAAAPASKASAPSFRPSPVDFQPMDIPAGKAGNLIFR